MDVDGEDDLPKMQVMSINQNDTLYQVYVHDDNGATEMIPMAVELFQYIGHSAHHFKVVPSKLRSLIQTIEAMSTKNIAKHAAQKRRNHGLPKVDLPKKQKLDENPAKEETSVKPKKAAAAIK